MKWPSVALLQSININTGAVATGEQYTSCLRHGHKPPLFLVLYNHYQHGGSGHRKAVYFVLVTWSQASLVYSAVESLNLSSTLSGPGKTGHPTKILPGPWMKQAHCTKTGPWMKQAHCTKTGPWMKQAHCTKTGPWMKQAYCTIKHAAGDIGFHPL
jgi:hypothetical protein